MKTNHLKICKKYRRYIYLFYNLHLSEYGDDDDYDDWLLLVDDDVDVIIGFIDGKRHENTFYIDLVQINKNYRNRGLCTFLMDFFGGNYCKRHRIDEVSLDVVGGVGMSKCVIYGLKNIFLMCLLKILMNFF